MILRCLTANYDGRNAFLNRMNCYQMSVMAGDSSTWARL